MPGEIKNALSAAELCAAEKGRAGESSFSHGFLLIFLQAACRLAQSYIGLGETAEFLEGAEEA